MNDSPTIASRAGMEELQPSSQKSGTKTFLIGGGVGCMLLLCLGLLAGSTLFLVRQIGADSAEEAEAAEEVEVAAAEEEAIAPAKSELEREQEAENEPILEEVEAEVSEASNAPTGEPEMGQISFVLETDAAGEGDESSFVFEVGVTQLHAVFEYANLAPSQTWTQVWYHNGNEVFRTSQPWLEAESGVFDYIIEAGGEPLPAGQWALEFLIDDALLTAGSFVIESPDAEAGGTDEISLVEMAKVYKLAYTRWNGEKHDLYVGDTNGSVEQFIMGRAAGPSWSPDGRYLFFYGEEGVDQQVINGKHYPLPGATNGLVRIDAIPLPASIGQVRIFQGHGWNDGTARSTNISPDGTMIAYDGDRGGGRRVYFLGTSANQQFRYEIIGEQADWAPDSQRIVYRSGRNNQTGLWISNRTDTGHIWITNGGTDSFPAWAYDGETIAFSRDVGGNVDIYTVKPDGTNLTRLTTTPGHDTLPLYLPNGELVFRSARNGRWGIWKMQGDGANQVEIITNAPVGPEWAFSRMDVLR